MLTVWHYDNSVTAHTHTHWFSHRFSHKYNEDQPGQGGSAVSMTTAKNVEISISMLAHISSVLCRSISLPLGPSLSLDLSVSSSPTGWRCFFWNTVQHSRHQRDVLQIKTEILKYLDLLKYLNSFLFQCSLKCSLFLWSWFCSSLYSSLHCCMNHDTFSYRILWWS